MDGGLDAVRLEVPDELSLELEQAVEPLQMVSHRQFRCQRGTKTRSSPSDTNPGPMCSWIAEARTPGRVIRAETEQLFMAGVLCGGGFCKQTGVAC